MSNLVQSDIQACNTNCQGISSVFLKERGCLMVNQVPWSVSRVWFNVCISRGWSGLRLLWPWILGYYDPGYEERSAWECGDSKESFWTKIIHEVSEVSLEKQNIQPKTLLAKDHFRNARETRGRWKFPALIYVAMIHGSPIPIGFMPQFSHLRGMSSMGSPEAMLNNLPLSSEQCHPWDLPAWLSD